MTRIRNNYYRSSLFFILSRNIRMWVQIRKCFEFFSYIVTDCFEHFNVHCKKKCEQEPLESILESGHLLNQYNQWGQTIDRTEHICQYNCSKEEDLLDWNLL